VQVLSLRPRRPLLDIGLHFDVCESISQGSGKRNVRTAVHRAIARAGHTPSNWHAHIRSSLGVQQVMRGYLHVAQGAADLIEQ
jgi:hypothetical protein